MKPSTPIRPRPPIALDARRRVAVSHLLLVSFALIFTPFLHAAVIISPPENSPEAAAELKGIARELADRNLPAAAKRIDSLLSARTEQLASLSENSLTSALAWLDQLSPPQRAAIAAQYSKTFADPARQSLDSLLKGRTSTPEELYAIARRYPMTPAAANALTQAGDRALQLGDFPAAEAFYELALHEGATLGQPRAQKLAELKKYTAGAMIPAPSDVETGASPLSAKPTDRLPYSGALPFDAPWYGVHSMLGVAKFFPYAYDDRVLISSWKGVTMLRENGQFLWSSPNTTPPGQFPIDRPAVQGRGALFAPAVLTDVHGRPTIIVVRQPTAQGEAQYILRALRASDGKTLWSTPPGDWRNEFTYAGLPAVSGRSVYCMAAARTGVSSANLLLCCLDINTGQSLWQTTLGAASEQGDIRFGGKFGRGQPLSFESFADLSQPAISGDLALVAPNSGALMAIGRFDGKIRWVYTYRPADAAVGVKAGRLTGPPEGERRLQTRYQSTPVICGEIVVLMPQDATNVFAVDRDTGIERWHTNLDENYALVGGNEKFAVFSGPSITFVDVITAKRIWTYTPPRGTHLTGPAIVRSQTALAPTTAGFVQLNINDRSDKPVYAIPNLRHLLTTDPAKAAMNDLGTGRAFAAPPAPR